MGGPAPSPNRGRLVLVLFGVAVGAVAAWLLVKTPTAPPVPAVVPQEQAAEQPIAAYLARADAARGEAYFQRCAACHTIAEGGPHSIGPNLYGVMGRPLASRPGFASYSAALREKGGSWDWASTNAFLRAPREFVPGTRMAFGGVLRPEDRADLMLYLNRQGGTLPVPAGAQ
jgi:cytochrome c